MTDLPGLNLTVAAPNWLHYIMTATCFSSSTQGMKMVKVSKGSFWHSRCVLVLAHGGVSKESQKTALRSQLPAPGLSATTHVGWEADV